MFFKNHLFFFKIRIDWRFLCKFFYKCLGAILFIHLRVGLTASGQSRSSGPRNPTLKTRVRDRSRDRLSGVRSRASGSGPEPVPVPEYLNLDPDRRDLGPENESN